MKETRAKMKCNFNGGERTKKFSSFQFFLLIKREKTQNRKVIMDVEEIY